MKDDLFQFHTLIKMWLMKMITEICYQLQIMIEEVSGSDTEYLQNLQANSFDKAKNERKSSQIPPFNYDVLWIQN